MCAAAFSSDPQIDTYIPQPQWSTYMYGMRMSDEVEEEKEENKIKGGPYRKKLGCPAMGQLS